MSNCTTLTKNRVSTWITNRIIFHFVQYLVQYIWRGDKIYRNTYGYRIADIECTNVSIVIYIKIGKVFLVVLHEVCVWGEVNFYCTN